jgi:hypothetical protein
MSRKKSTKHYVIGTRVMLQRGSTDGSGREPRWTYVPTAHYGTHTHNIDAKRAYVLTMYPELPRDLAEARVRWYVQDAMARREAKVLAVEEAAWHLQATPHDAEAASP